MSYSSIPGKLTCLFIFLHAITAFSYQGNVVSLSDAVKQLSIGKSIYYFEDPSQQIKFDDIVSGKYDSAFSLNTREVPNFGNKKTTYWNTFTLHNATSGYKRWMLVIDEHHLDSIELYCRDSSGHWFVITNGRSTPFHQREYKHNNYAYSLDINPGDTRQYYLKISGHLIIYPLVVMKYEQFIESGMERNVAKGIIIGLFLMIILYNFFIYLSVNDKNYLFYTAYAITNIIMICDLTGYMDSIWQGPLGFMWDKTPAIIAVDGILLMLFSKNILEFDKHFPFGNKMIYYVMIPIACWTIATNLLGYKLYASITNQFWVLILVVFLYIAAIIVYRRGYLPARFYIIACGAFFVACAIYAATLLGFVPVNNFTNHVIEIGSGIEMLLFSFALADKIRQFRKDKSEAQSRLLQTLKENETLILDQQKLLEEKVAERTKDLKYEKEKSENLLLNILPEDIAEELKEKGYAEARSFENVSIMFIEFEDFTNVSEGLTPKNLVEEINRCFGYFDSIVEEFGLEKIKTFGGAYLLVSGLPKSEEDSAIRIINAALKIRDAMLAYQRSGGLFKIKMGIHTGSVVAGIVGHKKFAFDIWGDVVNTAARMQQNSEPGKINVSGITYEEIKQLFTCSYRGKVMAKNKGEIDMYFIEGFKTV